MFQSRTYRNRIRHPDLNAYQVTVKETDLYVQTAGDYAWEIRDLIIKHRGYLETYIGANPQFAATLVPWDEPDPLPAMIESMVAAGKLMDVGPMAAVAGALVEAVGRDLLRITPQVILENGGDVFLKTHTPVTLGVYAGQSPLSMKIGIHIDPTLKPKMVCTSSGSIGHSLSLGRADAVCVVADSGSVADAAATALGNLIQCPGDIGPVLESVGKIPQIRGVLAVMGETLGVCGELEIVPIAPSN